MKTILVTGHEGLVGRHLWQTLSEIGYNLKGLDVKSSNVTHFGDITNQNDLKNSICGCSGIVHLAAVSRVIWGQQEPDICNKVNAQASQNLLRLACSSSQKPWVLVASSREVYGEPVTLPVKEDAPLKPINVYGRAKVEMEQAAQSAREAGLNTAIVRLANVYGCTEDHDDRVLPAFCRAASQGTPLRVDGNEHTFDFTHISDTVEGIKLIVEQLDKGENNLPPMHLLPGIGTTLLEAAEMAVRAAGSESKINEAQSRDYDVSRFIGDPKKTKALLGWEPKILPQEGIGDLVSRFQMKFQVEAIAA